MEDMDLGRELSRQRRCCLPTPCARLPDLSSILMVSFSLFLSRGLLNLSFKKGLKVVWVVQLIQCPTISSEVRSLVRTPVQETMDAKGTSARVRLDSQIVDKQQCALALQLLTWDICVVR